MQWRRGRGTNGRCYVDFSILGAAHFWLGVGCCLLMFSYNGGMGNEWKWLDFLCLQCMRKYSVSTESLGVKMLV